MTVAVETARPVRAATWATYAAFIGSGFGMSTWATRIPQVRDGLALTPSRLGLVLLAIAAGSIVALVMSGYIVARFGSRRTVMTMAVLFAFGLTGVAFGYHLGVWPVVAGLFLFGFANGAWDVAMNVQGAVVERRLGRSIMSRFHAGYSVGTVAGALIGAGVIALGVPVTVHLIAGALAITSTVIYAVRAFVADDSAAEAEAAAATGPGVDGALALDRGSAETAGPAGDEGAAGTGWRRTLATWREPRTLLVGVFVLAFAFAEGAGIDWIAVALIDDYGAPVTVGTLAFALFLAAMTAGRWFGPGLLDRYGRVPVLRVLAVISLAGLALFVFGWNIPVAFVGALFWGLGASLGFPVGMSAAADDPARAPARVSVVASIGYCAFLGGPPLIGFLGDHVTVQRGLIAVAVLLGVALAVANAIRPLAPAGES
ncbi:MAG TPA: MFS transporter [Actinoplanes sp.]|nr:MFS transporter [Actinoplanes sp.]